MPKESRIRTIIQNIMIVLLVLSGIAGFLLPLRRASGLARTFVSLYSRLRPEEYAVHGILAALVGFLLLLLSYKLYKRMRFAWAIELAVLSVSVALSLVRTRGHFTPMNVIQLLIIAVLAAGWQDFSRRSSPITVKWSLILTGGSALLVFFRTAVGFFLLKSHFHHVKDFGDALYQSVRLLFFMDLNAGGSATPIGRIFARSAVALNWIFIVFAALLILKPLVYNPIRSHKDLEHVRKLVLAYGQNPASYLALENDKRYFFGAAVDGAVAFTVAADVAVCCGDILCAEEDAFLFLSEFMSFCRQNGWDILMLNTTDDFLPLCRAAGFGCVKYGEEALFRLSEYSLAGGRAAKVRAAVNHAVKAGITAEEYRPLQAKDVRLEHEMEAVSKSWLKSKKSPEMAFMLGGVNLAAPMDRRYFVAKDAVGRVLGFAVFLPYAQKQGYIADVTRRLPDAPQGVLELIIYTAFTKMRDEGVEWGSMGLSPLANVREEKAFAGRLFHFVYENLNSMYGFKALRHAKEKYAPTEWRDRYMVYYPRRFTIPMAYSIVKSQNPEGISRMVLTSLRRQAGREGETRTPPA